jgi:hypothetical protein
MTDRFRRNAHNAQHHILEGQTHEVAAEALAPVLVEFFAG